MNYLNAQIVFQEVPNEISLALLIGGCPMKCPGCHSSHSWSKNVGKSLGPEEFESLLNQYKEYISCVVFLGGEWEPEVLTKHLDFSSNLKLKTCLYTGLELEDVSPKILDSLTYIKCGPFKKEFGGLKSPRTNQTFLNLKTNENLNSHFTSTGGRYDSLKF